jgi:hypothetical protein
MARKASVIFTSLYFWNFFKILERHLGLST